MKNIHVTVIGDDLENWNKNFEKYFSPTYIQYIKNEYNITLNDLKQVYFNGQITKENRINITKLFSDVIFVKGTHKALKIQVEKSSKPTYFYIYSYDKTLSANKQISKINEKGW